MLKQIDRAGVSVVLKLVVALLLAGCVGPSAGRDAQIAAGVADGVALVRDGQPRAVIVAPADREPLQMNGVDAVDELVEHIRLIAGTPLPPVQHVNRCYAVHERAARRSLLPTADEPITSSRTYLSCTILDPFLASCPSLCYLTIRLSKAISYPSIPYSAATRLT
jgi:hypothetical protein